MRREQDDHEIRVHATRYRLGAGETMMRTSSANLRLIQERAVVMILKDDRLHDVVVECRCNREVAVHCTRVIKILMVVV